MTHREPVILHNAAGVPGVWVPGPPHEVTQRGVRVDCSRRVVLHVLGHVAQKQHVRLLQSTVQGL